MNKVAYLYVLDTMADWEVGYLVAELNSGRYFKKNATKYTVKTFGLTKKTVVTMGGVRIEPDYALRELDNAGILILPGGETWLEPFHLPLLEKVKECLNSGIPVAAICGATIGLAQAGLLNERYHTSNDLSFLKSVCPNYKGEDFYRQEPVVTDANLTTASPVAPLEFAYQVLKSLNVFLPGTLESWYRLNSTREGRYFYSLMESLDRNDSI